MLRNAVAPATCNRPGWIAIGLVVGTLSATAAFAQQPAWVARSNENARLLMALQAKFSPEGASAQGVPGVDEQINGRTH